jgi:hypothetical protein
MHLSPNHAKLMNKNSNNFKNNVIQTFFSKVTQIKVINIFIVKTKLKALIINKVAVLKKNNLQIKKMTVGRLN